MLMRNSVVWSTRKAHNLEIAGSNPASASIVYLYLIFNENQVQL